MDDISPQQISNAITSVAATLFQLFFHPFVLVTRVFFHREMGERYFTEMHAYLCLIAIAAASATSVLASDKAGLAGGKAAIVIGVLWALAFLYFCGEHFRVTVPNRYRNGIKWHSRSDGIARLPWLSYRIQYAIIFVAMVATGIFQLWGIALLLFFSLWASMTSDYIVAMMFWNRVLDSIDGQIDAEELGRAVKLRLTPAQARGLRAPMPACASSEFRENAAALLTRSAGTRQNISPPSVPETLPARAATPSAAPLREAQTSTAPTASAVSRKPFGIAGASAQPKAMPTTSDIPLGPSLAPGQSDFTAVLSSPELAIPATVRDRIFGDKSDFDFNLPFEKMMAAMFKRAQGRQREVELYALRVRDAIASLDQQWAPAAKADVGIAEKLLEAKAALHERVAQAEAYVKEAIEKDAMARQAYEEVKNEPDDDE